MSNNVTTNLFSVITGLILFVGYFFVGPRHGLDSHGYIQVGELILDWLFHGNVANEPFPEHVQIPKYLFPSILLGVCYDIFGDNGHQAVIALNGFLFSCTAFLLFKIWILLDNWSHEYNAVMLVGGLFLIFGLVDTPLWVYYDLSDIIFLWYATLLTYILIYGAVNKTILPFFFALILVVGGYFVRPTAIIFPLIFLIFTCTLIHWPTTGLSGLTVLLSVGLSLLLVFLLVPAFVDFWVTNEKQAREIVPELFMNPVAQSMHMFNQGWVVADRPNTYILNTKGYSDFLMIALHRIIYFFTPLRLEYSLVHNSLNSLYVEVSI